MYELYKFYFVFTKLDFKNLNCIVQYNQSLNLHKLEIGYRKLPFNLKNIYRGDKIV